MGIDIVSVVALNILLMAKTKTPRKAKERVVPPTIHIAVDPELYDFIRDRGLAADRTIMQQTRFMLKLAAGHLQEEK